MSYTREQIEAALKSKKYAWFEGPKDYDVNIVGIRNSATGKSVTNVFDDFLTISYKIAGVWQFKVWPITTDPGTKAVKQFSNPNGVARLIPNQYRNSHAIGLHKQTYEALRQQKPVKVWRDKNKNMTFDETVVEEGIFYINIHKSNPTTESQYVENWSEGCQVFKKVKDFNEFMVICNKAKNIHGNSFTYTLIESKDIV
ncbi:hypothetical protein [Flavobacterium pallidum]|uniref:Uncharacterized protein n=1 Tax=Flavobacterium pallidum TaxID=2172098 RepID=A0A2S1SJD7_9FLAO|nr:hypothetical protein [Flavobacterium pallidum]AWI26462.1 hypothetical protein HYN49_11415 [Flavobacterium pallidum]